MLWGFIAATGISFYNINPLAGYLFLPYQTWVSLATAITYYIWQNNKEKSE
jgi:tryptophan-rich sensory protein